MSSPQYRATDVTGWVGWIAFAGFIMIITGVLGAIQGLTAIIKDDAAIYAAGTVVVFDVTQWGWVHLIFGLILVLVGVSLLNGATWARVAAIILVGLNLIAQFAAVTWYPVWGIIAIVLDMLVLWALIVHGRETKAYNEMDS
jgi:hypothetical protein